MNLKIVLNDLINDSKFEIVHEKKVNRFTYSYS